MVRGEAVPVDVWLLPAGASVDADDGALSALLSPEERSRADRFRRPGDRSTYVAAHAALRRFAGARLGVAPGAVRLGREDCPLCGGPHGRPTLLDAEPRAATREVGPGGGLEERHALIGGHPPQRAGVGVAGIAVGPFGRRATGRATPGPGLEFSLSRTSDLAAVALSPGIVGVDVEVTTREVSLDDLLVALHPRELPVADRPAALRLWVRKEAYLKACGTGLGVDPASVDLSTDPPGWQVVDVPAGPGVLCAVAVRTSAPLALTVRTATAETSATTTGPVTDSSIPGPV